MGKVLNSLRNLGQKMTGVPITSVRVDRVLNEIAENYSGGGGGGGMLVINGTMDESEHITLDKTRSEIMQVFPNCLVNLNIMGQAILLNASGATSATPMFLGFNPALSPSLSENSVTVIALIVTESSVIAQTGVIATNS